MKFLRSYLKRPPVNEVSSILSYLYDLYLTIIPRVRIGYEVAIIISYPTSPSGIIVLLKRPQIIENSLRLHL